MCIIGKEADLGWDYGITHDSRMLVLTFVFCGMVSVQGLAAR